MSVNHLHNILCEKCQKDTLHVACKCRECGNVFVAPSQQRSTAKRRLFAKYGRERGLMVVARAKHVHGAALRAERVAKPDYADSRMATGLRSGRERTRA